MKKYIVYTFCFLFLLASCGSNNKQQDNQGKEKVEVPVFNPDSAYAYTAHQINFGPRVPNTEAHKACGNYLANELRRFGAEVVEQETVLYTYDNIALNAKNIIGSFSKEKKNRVLLCAHWDTRPFADEDPDPANYHKPIDGANDGAGASAVLLEIARQIGMSQPNVGVDIVFFDAEDWGAPNFDSKAEGGWCLGSDYWAKNPHEYNYKAQYGILLDMVSAPDARFYKEQISMYYAPSIVDEIWRKAAEIGYSNYFINSIGGAVTDDHVEVNEHRRIPCVNIIHYDGSTSSHFGSYWHTMADNIDNVSKETMKAVGQTVLYVLYTQ